MSKAKTLFVASSLLATVLGGCSLIKVNGKSLGGSSMPGGSSSGGSSPTSVEKAVTGSDSSDEAPRRLASEISVKTGPVGQAAAIYEGSPYLSTMILALDKSDRPSEIAKVIFVSQIFGVPGYSQPHAPLLRRVLGVAEKFDQSKAMAEIAAEKALSDEERDTLQRYVREAVKLQANAAKALATESAADPAISQLLNLANEAHKEWSTDDAKRSKLRTLVASLEAAADSNRRSAYQGCEEKALAAWNDAVAATKLPEFNSEPKRSTYLNAIVANPNGALAYDALRLCRDGFVDEGWGRNDLPDDSTAYIRGPRTAAVAKWLANAASITFDKRDMQLDRLFSEAKLMPASGEFAKAISGVIEKIESKGKDTLVTFASVKQPRVTCAKWETTNHVERIDQNGRFEYEKRCVSRSKVMMETNPDPIGVDNILARNLKPGMFLLGYVNLPIIATASPTSTDIVYVMGAAVK